MTAKLIRPLMGFVALLTVICAMGMFAQDAQALRVTLKRLVFEGATRAETLTIINSTDRPQTYRLGWRSLRMTEDSSLVPVSAGDEGYGLHPVDDMIKFSPRRVTLQPGESQQVRFMLRRPAGLADGEYRSHFWVQPEEEAVPLAAAATGQGKAAVQLQMLTGLTVPVIVRQGALTAQATLTDARLQRTDAQAQLTMTIERQGTRSLYGDIHVACQDGGATLAVMRGVAVYREVARRRVILTIPQDKLGACRTLAVRYQAPAEDSQFKGAVMAEIVL